MSSPRSKGFLVFIARRWSPFRVIALNLSRSECAQPPPKHNDKISHGTNILSHSPRTVYTNEGVLFANLLEVCIVVG